MSQIFTKQSRAALVEDAMIEQPDEEMTYPFADLVQHAPKHLKALKAAVAQKDRAAVMGSAAEILYVLRSAFKTIREPEFAMHAARMAKAASRITSD